MRILPVVLAAWASLVLGQDRPEQFSHAARISGGGDDSHVRFTLPAATYRGVTRPDLGDLRIFNGAGELVPYAFVPLRPAPKEARKLAAKLFPLHGDEAKGLDALSVRIHQGKGGTTIEVSSTPGTPKAPRKLLGYLLDPGDLQKAPLEALELDWQVRQGFTGSARVEGSEDLRTWRTLAAAATVLYLEHAGQRLERKRLELAGASARYLRISFTGVPADFALRQATLELRADKAEPAREWLSLEGRAVADRPGEYAFDTGGVFPVDRLRFALPQVNTVAQAQVFHRSRAEDPWRPATAGTLYRLRRNGAEVANADLAVFPAPSRYWLLKVDQRGGGLGGGEVRLEIGWVPHQVVFAARGEGPFRLAYGMKVAKPGALPIVSVLPDYKEGEAIALKAASLGEIVSPGAGTRPGLSAYLQEAVDSGQAKKWALWATLVAGVLVLLWMAFALLRQVGKR